MSECKRSNAGPWQSHPRRMLRHKAMIQCARLAFGYGGIYDQDEAERITEVKTGVALESAETIDVRPLITAALATHTDADAFAYWKENNAKLKSQPHDYAAFKQAVADHRAALRDSEIIDVEVKHETA